MKKLTNLIIGLAALVSITVQAQDTTNPPAIDPINTVQTFLGAQSTNWFAGVAGIYDYDTHKLGGRVGLAYSLLDGVTMPELAVEYFDGSFYMVSGTLQLRPPQKWLGKFPVTPFGEVGVKVPIAGFGKSNGDPIAFAGGGITARLSKHFLLLGAAEYRLNGDHKGLQLLFGPVYNF